MLKACFHSSYAYWGPASQDMAEPCLMWSREEFSPSASAGLYYLYFLWWNYLTHQPFFILFSPPCSFKEGKWECGLLELSCLWNHPNRAPLGTVAMSSPLLPQHMLIPPNEVFLIQPPKSPGWTVPSLSHPVSNTWFESFIVCVACLYFSYTGELGLGHSTQTNLTSTE